MENTTSDSSSPAPKIHTYTTVIPSTTDGKDTTAKSHVDIVASFLIQQSPTLAESEPPQDVTFEQFIQALTRFRNHGYETESTDEALHDLAFHEWCAKSFIRAKRNIAPIRKFLSEKTALEVDFGLRQDISRSYENLAHISYHLGPTDWVWREDVRREHEMWAGSPCRGCLP